VQAKLVQNLQQQVFFLELELKYLREHRGFITPGAKTAEGPPNADAVPQKQGREQASAMREAMLRAEFRKEQAQADKAKAIGELGRLRDKFTAQLQELTAEVVGLQSALEQRNQEEKMLRMDLAETTSKYEERKAFTESYDTRVRGGRDAAHAVPWRPTQERCCNGADRSGCKSRILPLHSPVLR
jgi:chromosome segregation ATPase